jgi:hypothetical protein
VAALVLSHKRQCKLFYTSNDIIIQLSKAVRGLSLCQAGMQSVRRRGDSAVLATK